MRRPRVMTAENARKLDLAIALSRAAHDHMERFGRQCPHDIGLVLEPVATAAIQAAVNEALEEAAKVAESNLHFSPDHVAVGSKRHAAAIRTLKKVEP